MGFLQTWVCVMLAASALIAFIKFAPDEVKWGAFLTALFLTFTAAFALIIAAAAAQ